MFLQNSWQKFVNFLSFWYMRYLLVTELYIVEPWERAVMRLTGSYRDKRTLLQQNIENVLEINISQKRFVDFQYPASIFRILTSKMWRKSSSLYKYFLFLFNLIFVVSSLLLMSVGLIIRGQYQKYREFLDEHFFSLPFMLICVGIILLVVTFFGCCGALQENYCMIWMFSILLGLLFILETTLGFTAYALSDKAHNILSVSLNDTMQLYNKSFEITNVWDSMQINLRCCGINTYTDWYPVLNNSLPMSCCDTQTGAVGQEICNESVSTLHHSSCLDSLSSIIVDNATTLGAAGIGIALGQVLGVFFSCVLARRIRNSYENFE